YPISRNEPISLPVDVKGIVNTTRICGGHRDVIAREHSLHEELHALNERDIDGVEYQNIAARAKGIAWKNDAVPKSIMVQVREYLAGMPLDGVQTVWTTGRYSPWHGDSKSRVTTKTGKKPKSQANFPNAYQTKTILTSSEPPMYRTIVAPKGTSSPVYVLYEYTEWEGTAEIVQAMLATFN
ncbi:hypothetical protein C0993_009000, partial [Termitomyces sp. T159_Od127]